MRSYDLAPKNGKPRHVPLHPELARVLRVWQRECPPTAARLVFPIEVPARAYTDKTVPTYRMGTKVDGLGLEHVLAAAGVHAALDGKPWHLLRHTFASHAVMSGTSLYEVQQLLGHATPTMTQRYAHLAPDHLASAVARLNFAAPTQSGVADLGEARRKQAVGVV